jgi:2-dehydropantoate 2-reductase
MKHAILGAGAIGGLMGTRLASLGEDVTLIVRPGEVADYPKTLSLESPSGTITGPAKVAARVSQIFDVLWVATKTYQLEGALEVVDTTPNMVVPLLNGVDHVAVLRARFGQGRVVPATIAVEADRRAAARFVQRSPARLHLAASGEPALKDLVARLQEEGLQCQFIANEATLLWSKLCFLEPLALATTASGKNLGEIRADPEWQAKLDAAMAEAWAVATKAGAQVDAEKLRTIFVGWAPTLRASMAKDLAAGRRLELDGIAGPVVRGGTRYGIPVPTTAGLIATIESLITQCT